MEPYSNCLTGSAKVSATSRDRFQATASPTTTSTATAVATSARQWRRSQAPMARRSAMQCSPAPRAQNFREKWKIGVFSQ